MRVGNDPRDLQRPISADAYGYDWSAGWDGKGKGKGWDEKGKGKGWDSDYYGKGMGKGWDSDYYGKGKGKGKGPPLDAPCQWGMLGLTGMDQLERMQALDVQEKANVLQEVTALLGVEIEMANKYNILDLAGNSLFYAVERTNCCTRQLQTGCCHDCAPWEVDVLYTPPGQLHQQFLALKRPCQFTCCCWNRPIANVIDETTQQKIGSFRDPCTCCLLKFQVRDAQDEDVLVVDGGCCLTQPGMWCPLPCGPCSEVKFDVQDARTGASVASISKRVPGCIKWCFAPDVDNYHLVFDQVQNAQWKAILLAFSIFMDFRYFNMNRNNENAREHRHQGMRNWQSNQD